MPGGTWTIGTADIKASNSVLSTRVGHQLQFLDSLGDNSLRFFFRSRPEAASTFTPASDTSKNSNVMIRMERDGIGYHATSTSNGAVSVSLPENKLYLQGTAVRMAPDSSTHPELLIDFRLREF